VPNWLLGETREVIKIYVEKAQEAAIRCLKRINNEIGEGLIEDIAAKGILTEIPDD